MTESELYALCDSVIGPCLRYNGFTITQPADYARRTEAGADRITVSRGPGRRARTHFAVFMSFEPDYLKIVEELIPLNGEDRGFSCGPYLNPIGVSPRPKYWPFRNREVASKSVDHAYECIRRVGLPWLETLRDPIIFAERIDPVAALPAGVANEVAGNKERARAFYQEMLRRYKLVMEQETPRSPALPLIGRPFVFVTAKLAVEQEKRKEYQERLGYYPEVTPL